MKRTPPAAGERVYLATVRDGATYGVAIQRDDGPVIIGQSDAAAAIAFADDLARDCPGLQGVVGALPAAEAFAQRWHELTGRAHRLRVRLRQHALATVNDVPAAPGAPRTATEADTEWLIEGQCAFMAEVGMPDPPERVRELLPKRVLRGEFRIWDDGGRVAFAGFSDAAPDFARIAPVYTLPGSRGRGYATSLVAQMSRELLARGKRQAVPDDRHRQPDVECDLRAHRISRRERRLALRFRRAGAVTRWRRPASSFPRGLAPGQVGATVELHEAAAHHATRVLRLAAGDALTLFDGTGGEYAVTLVHVDKRGATVRVEGFLPIDRESPLAVTLAQGIAANDAMDYAIRKATELGVTSIQPLVTARSAPLPPGERGDRRLAHWRGVAIAACEQCGRNRVPEVSPPQALTEWLAAWEGSGIVFAPDARALARRARATARRRSRC